MEFTRLPELRKQAEGWRTGLTGLTALLTVLALLKGPDSLADLPEWARILATAMLVGAFLLLVAGSLLAVRSAHGAPEPELVLGGQALRRWTEREAARVARALGWASVCCLLGLLLVVGSLALAWTTTSPTPTHLVRVDTNTGSLCGELLSADQHQILIRRTVGSADVLAVSVPTVLGMQPTDSCGSTP